MQLSDFVVARIFFNPLYIFSLGFSECARYLVHEPSPKKWIFLAPPLIPSETGIKLKLKD